MKDESSVFGAKPDNLDRLLRFALEPPEEENEATLIASLDTLTEKPGGRIDNYKLLRVLGEGGMGIVYLAQQEEPVRRQVALKVIKPGMDSKRIIARFEAEKQALALMQHPHIAGVYDAGLTLTGRPYFVMEYVQGLPITEHCDHYKLTIEQRLRLFQHVCQAVQHAHQKGIIHRDIKPSNILVSIQEDKATPKIIDFGVAKAIAQPLTEQTLTTAQGQLFGTPEYMSPEQTTLAGGDTDTRSDIYSLGVLLYVLLTGVLPFDSEDLREGGIDHIRKLICETDPKTPSTRLTSLGEGARKVAESRRTEVATLARRLHKELEWIPLKAMRKQRSQRYRSASELSDDVGNYLKGAPLTAGPPGTVYRLKKFVRRNRALVTGIAAVLVVLATGIIVSMIFAIGQARVRIEAQAVSDFLRHSVLASLDPFKVGGREITVRSVLDAASKSLDGDFQGTPLAEAEIQDTLGNAYWSLGLYKQAEAHLKRALDIQRTQRGFKHPSTLATAHQLGWVYFARSRYRKAEHLLIQTRETRRRLLGEEDPNTLYSTIGLACVVTRQGHFQRGEELLEQTLEIGRRVLGEEHLFVLGAMNAMAWNYERQGRYDDAEQLAGKGLEIARRVLGENDWVTLLLKHTLARIYMFKGRFDEAEKPLQEALKGRHEAWGSEHPDTLETMATLGRLYYAQGRYGEAESHLDQALKNSLQFLGEAHFITAVCMVERAAVALSQGQYEQAETLLEKALSISDHIFGQENWFRLSIMNWFGKLNAAQGRYDQAEPLLLKVLEARRRVLGQEHPETFASMNDLAVLRSKQGRYDEAGYLFAEALKGRQLKLGEDHPDTLESLNDIGVMNLKQGRYGEAKIRLREAYRGRAVKLGPEHPMTLKSLNNLIELYEAWGKPELIEVLGLRMPDSQS